MLFFSKKKPVLKDLIPDGHIDIHSHLLPAIDDGSKSMEDTQFLLKSLLDFGITQVVTTPHIIQYVWENTHKQILANHAHTKLQLQQNGMTNPFAVAAEYLMDDAFVKLFQTDKLLTIKDNYVLVEMSYINAPIQLYTILFDLQVAGYIPVLAHPERYLFYHFNFDEYAKLKNAGCLFQLNMLSVVGYYGPGIAKVADDLLQKGMYDFVGTDVHHERHINAFDQKVVVKNTTALNEIIKNNQFFKQ